MHILIVEDDEHIVLNLNRGLSEAGYEISVATTVAEGRRRLVEQAIQLVLLDLGLPGEDGLVLLQHIRDEFDDLPEVREQGLNNLQGEADTKIMFQWVTNFYRQALGLY